MFKTITISDRGIPHFHIGDRVYVNGTLAQGKGKVVATCYPQDADLPDNLPVDYTKPFPQVIVALDELNKKGVARLITYDGDDLAAQKVIYSPNPSFRLGDFQFDVAALADRKKFAAAVALYNAVK